MKVEKMNGETLDITKNNIEKLKEIFPDVFTEGKIDFEALKENLGEEIETENEKYYFSWNGKEQAKKIAREPSKGTLRPDKEESKDWDNTENLYIEGDNLEVLKLLQKSYYEQVKMIYIDPPYNTGKDFVYKDNFKDNLENYLKVTGQVDEDGDKQSTNKETEGRYHSNWLNMMYPRLKLARNLLREDGVIFISIDDNEVHNLRKICDEIFGEDNLVSQIPWQARQSVQNDTDLSSSHEYIVVYAKNRRQTNRRLKESNKKGWYTESTFACLPLPLDKDKFSNPDKDSRGLWKADPFDAPNIRPNLTYEIKNPNTEEVFMPPKGRCWRTTESEFNKLLKDNRIIFGKSGTSKPQLKVFYEEKKEFGRTSNTWFDGNEYGTATKGTKILQSLFGGAPFDTPKPLELLKKIINLSIKNKGVVLDFFSGSATTAHAVMKLNAEDGGNRKYIMVQLPEKTDEKSEAFKAGYKNICEIGKERIRRAGEQVKEELKKENQQLKLGEEPKKVPDIGFKVFKLETSNIKEWDSETEDLEASLFDFVDNLKSDRTSLDIVYEVLLKYGLPLDSKIKDMGKFYSVAGGTLRINLDKVIDDATIKAICDDYRNTLEIDEDHKTTVVLRETSFRDSVEKTNKKHELEKAGIKEIIIL